MKRNLFILSGIKKSAFGLFIMFSIINMSLSIYRLHYEIKEGKVFYNNENTEEVYDFETFKILNATYDRDKNHVYYSGKILDNAEAESFEVLSSANSGILKYDCRKDNKQIFLKVL